MTGFVLRFLGAFQVHADGTPVTNFHSDKVRALLAYLALEPRAHTRTELAALLWPEVADSSARANLRSALHRLRHTLDAVEPGSSDRLLSVSRQSICFNPEAASIDVHRFQGAVPDARSASSAVDADRLEEAVALYRGELLSGFGLGDASAFEEWLFLRREVLHQQALVSLHTLATAYEAAGNHERAHAVAGRLLTLDPYREETHRQIMRLLARLGQPDRALDQLERLRQLLRQEMGVNPAAETLALAQQIATGEVGEAQSERLRKWQEDEGTDTRPEPATHAAALDVSEVPMTGDFFGRDQERRQIAQWLVQDRCQVVAILGIGGMGKTTLAAQCAYDLAGSDNARLDALYWRSLVNAPPLDELLPPLLQALSHQQLAHKPESLDEQLRLLLDLLRERRVLLVLDNMESILELGEAGTYRPGYASYGQLIRQLATLRHRSHVILTSRERPRGVDRLERDGYPIKSTFLAGLDTQSGRQLFLQRGLQGDGDQEARLITRYSGNPLALKLVADTVGELFGGDMAEFLADDTLIFDDIRTVLDQHFARLTDLEQQILFWLAIERVTTPLATLRGNLLTPPPQRVLLETVRNLHRHSLVERFAGGFGLQNVIVEYLTDRLVDEVYTEISSGTLRRLHHHALVKTQSQAYVRQSQIRVMLEPVMQRLQTDLTRAGLQDRLIALIRNLQSEYGRRPSYAGGTILNALIHLDLNLEDVDLSGICLWQVDLRNQEARRLNLAGADLAHAVFTQTFGRVEAVAVSPDGQRFAIGGDGGYVRLYDMASRQFLLALSGHTNTVAGLAFAPASNQLASAGHDGAVRLWDLERQEQTHLWNTPGAMLAVDFNPDGSLLIGVGHTGVVYVWDVVSGLLRAALEGHQELIRSLAVHPDGKHIATGSIDGEIRLWSLCGERPDTSLAVQHDVSAMIALAFSPDGLRLASGGHTGTIALWEAKSLDPLVAFQAHTMETRSLVFGADSRILYSGGGGGASSIRIWDVDRNELLARMFQDETTWSLGLTPDGKTLVSGREDGTVHLWNVAKPAHTTLIHTIVGYRMSLTTLAWSPCGRWLATGDVHGDIRVWDVSGGQPKQRHQMKCEDGAVTAVAFSPNGNLLASASGAATQHSVRLWDTTSGTPQAIMHSDIDQLSLAFAHGGATLIGSGRDGIVRFWAFGTPELHPKSFRIHAEPGSFYAACDRTGTLMVTHGEGKPVNVWGINATAGEAPTLLHAMTGHRANRCAALDSETNLLACTGPAYAIALWHLAAPGEAVLRHTLEGHTNQITSVAFSPDGSRLASCSFDRTVRLWDVETGGQLARLGEHPQFALGIAFSPDGARVASIGKEGSLCIWHLGAGELEHVLKAPPPYDGMNITGITGISEAQRASLKALGAVED